MNKYVLTSLAATLGAVGLQAQTPLNVDGLAGIGRATSQLIDCDALTGLNGNLGVHELNGVIYVTARGSAGGTAAPHTIATLPFDPVTGTVDPTQVVLNLQDAATSSSAWGFRDGADDGTSLFFGFEGGVIGFDPVTGAQATTIQAANGPQAAPLWPLVEAGGTIGTHRALAYDPNGNGGNGSFFTANFGSDIVEFDLSGNVLNTFPLPTVGTVWSAYGFALDTFAPNTPASPSLWINSAPNDGEVREYQIDRANSQMIETGRVIEDIAGIQGGLDLVQTPFDGRAQGHDIIQLQQGAPDVVQAGRVNLWNAAGSDQDGRLAHRIGTDPFQDGGVLRFETGITAGDYELQINAGTGSATQGAIFLSFAGAGGAQALQPAGAFSFLDISLQELVIDILSPVVASVPPLAIGDISTQTATLPNAALNAAGSLDFTFQGVYLDFTNIGPLSTPNAPGTIFGSPVGLPIQTTNVVGLETRPQPRFQLRTSGANSFNADPTVGFWTMTNNSPTETITKLTVDAVAATGTNATMVFDADQTGMADVFWGGNSAVTGCLGTYRNGSDVAAGLVYTGTPAAGCDPIALQGFLGTGGTGTSYATIEFNFTPGTFDNTVSFEWDMDTDGGAGITGDAMAGLVITIELASGAVLTAPITAAGADGVAQFF